MPQTLFFQKENSKQVSYRGVNTAHGPPWARENGYETLDYILAPNRWKNAVLNAETDTSINDSDHYPIIAKIKVKLKAKPKTIARERQKYGEILGLEGIDFNRQIMQENLQPLDLINNATKYLDNHFPIIKKKEKENPCSEILREMLNFRDEAMAEFDLDAVNEINRHIDKQKKSRKKEKYIHP